MQEAPRYRLGPRQAARHRAVGTTAARVVFAVPATVDPTVLRDVLGRIVARHESLRTRVVQPAGFAVPLQEVHDELDGIEPFRVEAGPAGERLVVLELPSMLLDEASVPTLAAELAWGIAGAGPEPAEEPLAAVDFTEWEHDLAEDAEAVLARRFWAERPDEELASPRLPFEHQPAEADPGGAAAGSIVTVPVGGRAGLDDESWLTLFAAAIGQLTGEADVTVAVHVDGRHLPEAVGAVGRLGQALPVRLAAAPAVTVSEALDHTRRALNDLRRFEDLAAISRPATAPVPRLAFRAGPPQVPSDAAPVRVIEQDGLADASTVRLVVAGDDVVLEVDQRRWDASHAERLARSLWTAAAAWPRARDLGDLLVPDEVDRRQVVEDFNRPLPPVPTETVVAAWRRAGDAAPDAPAVQTADAALTHAELRARSHQVARALTAAGVAPGAAVGLCLDRTTDLVAALAGILTAGAAYVPLHPEHPPARLAQQLAQAGATVLLTDSAHLERLADLGVAPITMDGDAVNGQPTTDPGDASSLAAVAYVLSTSGSTGTPKSVAVTHTNLAAYTVGAVAWLGLDAAGPDAGARWHFASVTSVTTDLGNTAIFPALATGGCLHLVDAQVAQDPAAYAAEVGRHPVDVLKITPSHLDALVRSEGAAVLPGRHLVCGGEALSWDLVERVGALAACRISNHYGPTETTVGACTFDVGAEGAATLGAAAPATVPIGRPLPGARAYVLDAALRPLPVGAVGELWIGGAGVAQGYLGLPEETAARFVADTVAEGGADGGRMYRTGDLARFLPSGALEFLGRADQQVKIRGHRVELAEVEAALGQHPAVRQLVVAARPDPSGSLRLVAYVAASGAAPSDDEWRAFAADRLPDHMVPSLFVGIDVVPLTPSGKVDRRALPEPDESNVSTGVPFVAPRTDLERQLAEIWAEVLGRTQVGVDDDFFRLGGHSLLATQVVARVRHVLGRPLALHSLFLAPTVAQLAVVVDGLSGEGATEADADADAGLDALLEELDGLSDDELERLLAGDEG